ncbi:hypothetical protein [Inquilinus sp.]|jgi:hypothetical protein|uniref:hypothetical protein n=1 Tax=Inquilinus sp. TaxID=1932117 RepID=UPI0037839D4D
MPLRDIARLAIKIAGLIIIVVAVTDVPHLLAGMLPLQPPMTVRDVVAMAFTPPAIAALIGLLMVWGAGRIADRLLAGPAAPAQDGGLDLRGVEEVAIAAIGLYFVATGIADAVYYWGKIGLYHRFITENALAMPVILEADFGGILSAAARVVIGALLFLLSRGVVAMRRRLLSLRPLADRAGQD